MFQLIIAVIAIVLIAVLVIAAIFYGGDVWSGATTRAEYGKLLNQAGQIDAALQLYYQDKGFFPTETDGALLDMLATNGAYLSTKPQGNWVVKVGDNGELYLPRNADYTEDQCGGINKVAGKDSDPAFATTPCPVCDDDTFKDWPACKVVTP